MTASQAKDDSMFSEALCRTLSKEGAVFLCLFTFSSFLFFVAVESHLSAAFSEPPSDAVAAPFIEAGFLSVGGPHVDTAALVLSSFFIGSYFVVASMRVHLLGYDATSLETYLHDVERPTVRTFLGTLVFSPLLVGSFVLPAAVGLYFLNLSATFVAPLLALGVAPAALVAVSFAFYVPYVSVMREGVAESFVKSWRLSSGNRIRLVFLFLALVGFSAVSAAVFLSAYVFLWDVSTVLSQAMVSVGYAAALVFALSLVSSSFCRCRGSRSRTNETLAGLPSDDEIERRIC